MNGPTFSVDGELDDLLEPEVEHGDVVLAPGVERLDRNADAAVVERRQDGATAVLASLMTEHRRQLQAIEAASIVPCSFSDQSV